MGKTATDLEQSQKLAEILPLESADMHYARIKDDDDLRDWRIYLSSIPKICAEYIENVPCWSLAALLSVIPYNITFNKAVYRFKLVKFSEHWECYHENFGTVSTKIFEADNPIDVCYEMIIFLHDKNLI